MLRRLSVRLPLVGLAVVALTLVALSVFAVLLPLHGPAEAQGVAAAVPQTCSSISSLSRRCFFTFAKDCKRRGESREHCLRMSGFCHGCTDAYATCKGDAARLAEKAKSAAMDCAPCAVAYDRCIRRMIEQYGGKTLLRLN